MLVVVVKFANTFVIVKEAARDKLAGRESCLPRASDVSTLAKDFNPIRKCECLLHSLRSSFTVSLFWYSTSTRLSLSPYLALPTFAVASLFAFSLHIASMADSLSDLPVICGNLQRSLHRANSVSNASENSQTAQEYVATSRSHLILANLGSDSSVASFNSSLMRARLFPMFVPPISVSYTRSSY